MMTKAFVTPELITWARKRHNLSVEGVAKRISVSASKFEAWENGDAHPTLRQAETLAQKLSIPFGLLYLSRPPTLEIPLPDLRTVHGAPSTELSPEFYDVLHDALRKQQWYKDQLVNEGANPLPFVGRFPDDAPPERIAADMHDILAISREIRGQAQNWEEFLRVFVRKAEEIGVLVLQNGVVGNNTHRPLNADEFRGFVISDDIAPLVFLNRDDAESAQIFTLAHELAHLWIGQSGISNPDYRRRAREQEHPIERICDLVATEALVPEAEFLSGWDDGLTVDRNLWILTQYFKVSRVVVLRRAFELDRISQDVYWDHYDQIRSVGGKASAGQGGGHFFRNLLVRNSHTFTTAVVEAVLNGTLADRNAASLLNVQVATLDRFTKWMIGEPYK